MIPMLWPSSTGNGVEPNARTMWCVSYSLPTSVTRTLPATVATTAFSAAPGPYRFVYGRAADHGGTVEPNAELGCGVCPSSGEAVSGAVRAAADSAPSSACMRSSSGSFGGSTSQPNCASTLYSPTRGTVRQLSMLPVGHGEMQSMQKLHLLASTT